MIVDKILEYLNSKESTLNESIAYEVGQIANFSFRRQFMEDRESKPGLRLSAGGKCPRQQAYGLHGFEKKGKEIDGRAKIIFFQGDLVELVIVQLAKQAGCSIAGTGLSQMGTWLTIEEHQIPGHPDGVLFNGKPYLIEVKSMADFSFKKFEKGDVDDSYKAQVSLYMEAMGLDECVFVGLNKNNGIMHEIIIKKDPELVEKLKSNLSVILKSTKDKLPEPAYKVGEKGFYPWQCLYCSFWGHCRPNAEKVLVSRAYKLKEKKTKEPKEEDFEKEFEEETKKNVMSTKEKELDELEQLRQELKDDIIFRDVLGKSFGVENTFELTDKQRPAFKKEIRAIIEDLRTDPA